MRRRFKCDPKWITVRHPARCWSRIARHRSKVRRHGPPSPTWRTFLCDQLDGITALDMFVVVTAASRLLYVSVILGHSFSDPSMGNFESETGSNLAGAQLVTS